MNHLGQIKALYSIGYENCFTGPYYDAAAMARKIFSIMCEIVITQENYHGRYEDEFLINTFGIITNESMAKHSITDLIPIDSVDLICDWMYQFYISPNNEKPFIDLKDEAREELKLICQFFQSKVGDIRAIGEANAMKLN